MPAIRVRRLLLPGAAALLLLLLATAPVRSFGPARPGEPHVLSTHSVTSQTFMYVDAFYVDPKRIVPSSLLAGAFRDLESQYPELVLDLAVDGKAVAVRARGFEKRFDLARVATTADVAAVIDDVTEFVADRLGDDVERDKLLYLTVNGALKTLDPHTNVFSTKHFKDFKVSTSGSFGGIGFTFNVQEGSVVIVSPIPDTPAARAGLQSGDRILFIDGTPTTNMSSDAAVGRMRGEPGTQVTLTVGREGWAEPKDFAITREIIRIVSVESRLLEGDGPPVVYARIKNFQADTSAELAAAIRRLEKPGVSGVILDLRDNPGGLLEEAVKVADGFLDAGPIVSTRNRQGKGKVDSAGKSDQPFTRLPLVVLINRGSASASEIVSAALQDKRALLLGERTFGKGSVQQAFPLSDGGGVLMTVAQYLTPGDVSIQSIGIEPDVRLEAVVVNPDRVFLAPVSGHVTEGSLQNAFSEWGNARRDAVDSVRFLRTVAPPEGRAAEERAPKEPTEPEKAAKLAGEFEVRLARRVLAAAAGSPGATTRAGLLAAARGVLEQAKPEEESRIAAALAARGIDWADGAPSAAPARLAAVLPDGQTVRAGEKAAITVSLRNDGPAALRRLWGRTESANPLLRNLDFPFGTLEPGQTREWTATLDVPGGVEERWDTITLKLTSAGNAPAGTFTGSVQTRARPAPEYAWTYTLVDENPADPKKSGDGRLEEGERARLAVRLANRGAAESPLVEVNLAADDKEQFYMEEVRRKIEKLPAGGAAETQLSFRVIRALEGGKVKINLAFSDRGAGGFLADSVEFPTAAPYAASGSRTPPQVAIAALPPLVTDAASVTLSLAASDDGAVKDLFVFRGEKKLLYERNTGSASPFAVTLAVPLEAGSNRIAIVARDDRDIPVTKVLYVHRRGGEAVAAAPAPGSGAPAQP